MKILLTHRPGGAYGYISEGWLNALRAAGHRAERWDGQAGSWNSFDPDVYIGCSGHQQPIPQERRAKIAIHANPYGDINTGVNESPSTVAWVLRQKPNVVFGYGDDLEAAKWAGWPDRHNIPWVPMPTAGDSTVYFPRPEIERTIPAVYVGGYWPYKAKTIDKFLLPVRKAMDLRIYGWGNWPGGATPASDEEVSTLLASARVGPCITEMHTVTTGIDLPERAFKVALSGAVVVHDNAAVVKRFIPSAIVANNPAEFVELCKHWSESDERDVLADKQRQEVLAGHTYFHRMARLLRSLGISDSELGDLKNY